MTVVRKCDVWAHRCGAAEAPENTVAAIRHAVAAGVDGIELDVRLSADGVPVVIHDKSVDRTTNGEGLVSSMTLRELKELDAGYRFTAGRGHPFRGKSVTIPTLDEALFAAGCVLVNIELKEAKPELAMAVSGVLSGSCQRSGVLVASAYGRQARLVRADCPRAKVAAGPFQSLFWLAFGVACDFDAVEFPCSFLGAGLGWLAPLLALRGRTSGKLVAVWTVNGRANITRWLNSGVDAILTDEPTLALRLRKRLKARA